MDLGEKFKIIRKQRKFTIGALSEIAGSKSSISDFENGKTFLSTDVLLHLLSAMMVNSEEFFGTPKLFTQKEYTDFLQDSMHAIQKQDGQFLLSCATESEQRYTASGNYLYHILALNLQLIANEFYPSAANKNIADEMLDYFFSLNIWTIFDIGLWGNVVTNFSDQNVYLITTEILSEMNEMPSNNKDRIILDSALNSLSVLLKRHNRSLAKKLMDRLYEYEFPKYFMYQKTALAFYQCIYRYLWEDSATAVRERDTILATVKLLYSSEEAESWMDDFHTAISESKKA